MGQQSIAQQRYLKVNYQIDVTGTAKFVEKFKDKCADISDNSFKIVLQ